MMHEENNIPPNLREEQALFEHKKNDPQALLGDAKSIAFIMLRNRLRDPKDVLTHIGGVQYWQYLVKYHPKYMEQVLEKAKEISEQLAFNIQNHPEKFPMPSGAPAPGGTPVAATDKRTVQAALPPAGGTVYLRRESKDLFWLMNTFGCKLISSNPQPFIGDDGSCRFLGISSNEVRVSRHSHSVNEIFRMETEMKPRLIEMAATMAEEKGIASDDPIRFATALIEYVTTSKKNYLMLPVISRKAGPGIAFQYLNEENPFLREPDECSEIRSAIGKEMTKYVASFAAALAMDGIVPSESQGFMPVWTAVGKKQATVDKEAVIEDLTAQIDTEVSKGPRILKKEEVGASVDMQSLVLTLMSQERTGDEARQIEFLMCNLWPAYSRRPLEYEEAKADFSLAQMYTAATSDDAGFLEIYNNSTPSKRVKLAKLAYQQGRKDVIATHSSMAAISIRIADNDYDVAINEDIFSQLDPADPEAMKTIKKTLIDKKKFGKKLGDMILAKGQHALLSSKGYERRTIASLMGENPYAIAALAEDEEEMPKAISNRITKNDFDNQDEGLELFMAAMAKGSKNKEELTNMVRRGFPVQKIWLYAGEKTMNDFSRLTRIGSDGKDIPEASEIYSAPEEVMPLAKNLISIGDFSGLFSLFSLTLKAFSGDKFETMPEWMTYDISFMYQVLAKNGLGQEALSEINQAGIGIDKAGYIKRLSNPLEIASKEVTDGDVFDAVNVGNYQLAAKFLSMMYQSSPAESFKVLAQMGPPQNPKFFLGFLPREMVAQPQLLPTWARPKSDIEASVLPDGSVLVKDGYLYGIGTGPKFVSNRQDAPIVAMRKARDCRAKD